MSQQVDKKFSHVPGNGSWEIPRKTFHYSIGNKKRTMKLLWINKKTKYYNNFRFSCSLPD